MLIIGHRGACGLEPENTLRSVQRAMDLGVDMVEIDIYEHEGRLIVMHDETLDRTTNGVGKYSDYSLDHLRKLDAGKGERIPYLEEVIELIRDKVGLNIEIKGRGVVPLLHRMIHSDDGFLVSSYDWDQLSEYRQLSSEIALGVLGKDPFEVARKLNAYSVHPGLIRLTDEYMRQAREGGLQVFAHSVKSDKDWDLVKNFKVDGCFVNDPSTFHA